MECPGGQGRERATLLSAPKKGSVGEARSIKSSRIKSWIYWVLFDMDLAFNNVRDRVESVTPLRLWSITLMEREIRFPKKLAHKKRLNNHI